MNTEDEINKTLESLDHVERVELRPFFYTRLEGRMAQNNLALRRQKSISWAFVVVLLLLNVGAYFTLNPQSSSTNSNEPLVELKAEYYPETNDYYALIEEYETE